MIEEVLAVLQHYQVLQGRRSRGDFFYLQRCWKLHQSIIQRIQSDEVEKAQKKSSEGDNISVATTTLEPINIFCMDGGGAKGK